MRTIYDLDCDAGLFHVALSLLLEYDFEEGQRQTRTDPGISPHVADVVLVRIVSLSIEGVEVKPMNGRILESLRDMLGDHSSWFAQAAYDHCCEDYNGRIQDARESKAEERFQRRRDGE